MTVQSKTLLLVEDEALIAMEEARLLEKEGYAVVQAFSGAEAVEITGRMGPAIDLILMDIDLGRGMDGTEAAREILKNHDIPVVFLSSHTEKDIVAKTETITSYGYVVKNTGITVLDASIKMAFKLFEAHRDIHAKSMEVEAMNEELSATLEEMESANEELERSQRAIMESEERYRIVFDNMLNGFALLEALPGETGMPGDFRFVVINPAFEKLTGLRAGAVVGNTIREAIPNVESRWIERYGRVAVTGESDRFEEFSRDLGYWFSITAFSPQKGKVAVMFENITERKRAEEELKGRDSLIASISNNLPSTMIYRIIRDKDGNRRFSYVSETVRLFYGCSPDEAIADPGFIYGRVAEEDRERIWREEEASFRSLSEFRSEARMIAPDGGVRWSRFISTPEVLADGETRWDGIEIDITERKRMEKALRESNHIINDIVSSQPAGIYRIRAGAENEWNSGGDYVDFLEKLEEVDRIIRRAESLDAMLVEILDRVWIMFGSDRAWLLHPCDPAAPSFRVLMMRTRDEFALDLAPNADVPVTSEVAEAFGDALGSEEPLVFDPVTGRKAPLGDEFSIRSQIIIVLRPKIGDPWVFGMHQCSHARIWSLQDRRLFREIARRMTDGVNSMLLLRDLRESEERLRTLINAMPDMVCFKDGEGRWLEANDFTLRLFGLEGVDYRGKKDSGLAAISASCREAFPAGEDTDESAWRAGTVVRGDVAVPRPDGSAMTFDVIRVPAFTPEGLRKGLIVVGRDITDRVRTGEALALSEDRFRRMVDSVTDYIYTVTVRDGTPVATSHGPACENVTGYSPGDYEADPGLWYRMIHEQDRTLVEAQAARMLSGEGAGPIEHRIIHRDGSTRWVRNTPVLLKDGKGRPTGYDGLVVDITERKRAEEEIVRSAHEKDVLMKELQHRVKNNLGVIKGLLSLEMDNLADAASREVFQDAMDRIQSMAAIYEQLYGSSSIDRVDLKKYVGDIARRLFGTYAMDTARITLSLELDDAHLDVRRTVPLGLILNELIANALKYAYPSGKGGELRVRLIRAGGDITLEVSDDGTGLPADVRTGATAGMGIRLVGMLSKQIEAGLVLEGESGTTARITFPAVVGN